MTENPKRWWQTKLETTPTLTDGEKARLITDEEGYQVAQERQDIQRLFDLGIRNNDREVVKIARARLHFLEGKETLLDYEV